MFEITDKSFFSLYKGTDSVVVGFTVVRCDLPHSGFRSHAAALIYTLNRETEELNERGGSLPAPEPTSFRGRPIPMERLLSVAAVCRDRSVSAERFRSDDFTELYSHLFPCGLEGLEAFEWRTRQKGLFPEAFAWRGRELRTVYDPVLCRYSVFAAFTTG